MLKLSACAAFSFFVRFAAENLGNSLHDDKNPSKS